MLKVSCVSQDKSNLVGDDVLGVPQNKRFFVCEWLLELQKSNSRFTIANFIIFGTPRTSSPTKVVLHRRDDSHFTRNTPASFSKNPKETSYENCKHYEFCAAD